MSTDELVLYAAPGESVAQIGRRAFRAIDALAPMMPRVFIVHNDRRVRVTGADNEESVWERVRHTQPTPPNPGVDPKAPLVLVSTLVTMVLSNQPDDDDAELARVTAGHIRSAVQRATDSTQLVSLVAAPLSLTRLT